MTTGEMVATRKHERWLFGVMALLATAIVFAGFAPTYYLGQWFNAPSLTPLVHAHGIVFTAWIVLFGVQVGLVETRRTPLHRRVGIGGAVLALSMVIFGVAAAISSARQGHTPNAAIPALSFMAIPLFAITAFALLTSAAVALRRRPQAHKRLMLMATITIMAPAIARLPVGFIQVGGPPVFFGLTDMFLLAGVAFDLLTWRKVHVAWWLGSTLVFASQAGCLLVAGTEHWLAFARWLTG